MAVSDPTSSVPTPTGTLQGAAAFSWDGSTWQPAGAAYASVATPTGVLRGVAPFSYSGGAWQPSGLSRPGVPTPTGTLDGIALYNWVGGAWTPAGGATSVPTPSGTLLGVAAFYFDGTNWQPTGQAAPEVATPSGVLQGMAMFSPVGAGWAPTVSPASLDLNFLTMSALDPSITFTRASTATYFDANGVMQTAASGVARLDHDPVTHAPRGLLIEEARTNLLVQSAFQGGTWATSNTTLSAALGSAPDGTATLTRLAETAASGFHFVQQLQTLVASTQYTASVYAKAAEDRYMELSLDDSSGNGGFAVFDLQAGVISQAMSALGTGAITTASMQPVGNGFYRCSIGTTIGTATAGRFLIHTSQIGAPGWPPSYAGNAANGIVIWGAQLEQGAFQTSYIPTGASAVTRSGDVATISLGSWYSATAGTIVSEAMLPANGNVGYRGVFEIDGGVSNVFLRAYSQTGTAVIGGNVDLTALTFGTMTPGVAFKLGLTYAAAGTTIAFNGVMGSGTASVSTPATYTTLRLGIASVSGTNVANGYTRRVRYWPSVLSNSQLQQVTT